MELYEHKQFRRSLNALCKKGGPFRKAADEIYALLGRVGDEGIGDPFQGMRLTKHGESRIPHGVKYDLQGYSRLVTVQTEGYCILAYCGDHDDTERWLEDRRGWQFLIGDNKRVVETYRSVGDSEDERVGGSSGQYAGPLYGLLPEELYEELMDGVRIKVVRSLEEFNASVTDGELWETVAGIEDNEHRLAVRDVFALLRGDRRVEAIARIKAFKGELSPLDEFPTIELPEIVDSDILRRVDPKSPQYREALGRFMRSVRYQDWMLFMHPDQDRVVEEDFEGSAKLIGVSGSGKTCITVRRAVRLAELYRGQRILVLTLNRALAQLIDELVTACAPEDVRGRIDVKPFFVLCQELMLEINPSGRKLYDEVTWKNSEHVDEVWQEYYRCETNNDDADVFYPVHDSLLSRGWNPERYLRGEVDWLRSALRPDERARYLEIERVGRRVVLSRGFREAVLTGTRGWEDKMSVVGVIDALGLAQALAPHLSDMQPRYRCVLVDEVQDFGNIELEIIRSLVVPGQNDIFLCGDAAQAVTTKHQRFRDAGINIPGARSRKLTQNYRNSRDVLAAAYEVLQNNLTDQLFDLDLEVMDPEFSSFTGATPVLLEAPDLATELRGAFAYARGRIASDDKAKICIAICGFSLYELTPFAKLVECPILDGTTSLDDGRLFISDLPQTKGFEFDMVCIVNCAAGVLPDATTPPEERYRELAVLYVAMTRAKTDLVLSWSGAPSSFFEGSEAELLTGTWYEYVLDLATAPLIPTPQHLEAYRNGNRPHPWRDMTGAEFLYTSYALGISLELSTKIRALVDGKGLRSGSKRLKWAKLGPAVDSYQTDARSRNLWGPEVGRQLMELVAKLPTASAHARNVSVSDHTRTADGSQQFVDTTPIPPASLEVDDTQEVGVADADHQNIHHPFETNTGITRQVKPALTPQAARAQLMSLRSRIWRETGSGPSSDGLLRKRTIDAFLEHRPTAHSDIAGTPLYDLLAAVDANQRKYLPHVFAILEQLDS